MKADTRISKQRLEY